MFLPLFYLISCVSLNNHCPSFFLIQIQIASNQVLANPNDPFIETEITFGGLDAQWELKLSPMIETNPLLLARTGINQNRIFALSKIGNDGVLKNSWKGRDRSIRDNMEEFFFCTKKVGLQRNVTYQITITPKDIGPYPFIESETKTPNDRLDKLQREGRANWQQRVYVTVNTPKTAAKYSTYIFTDKTRLFLIDQRQTDSTNDNKNLEPAYVTAVKSGSDSDEGTVDHVDNPYNVDIFKLSSLMAYDAQKGETQRNVLGKNYEMQNNSKPILTRNNRYSYIGSFSDSKPDDANFQEHTLEVIEVYEKPSGMRAVLIEINPSGGKSRWPRRILAFAGTTFSSTDLGTDLFQVLPEYLSEVVFGQIFLARFLGIQPKIESLPRLPIQYFDACYLLNDVKRKYGYVQVCGHSLGGGLASFVSGLYDVPGVGFNPAPLVNANQWLALKYKNNPKTKPTFVNFCTKRDLVSQHTPGRLLGPTYIVETVEPNSIGGFSAALLVPRTRSHFLGLIDPSVLINRIPPDTSWFKK